jgi:negative regulator of sigma E activity
MQNDNRHTDKRLQELEKQSLPDLSKMDEHWQQMKTLLQPAVIPAKKKTIGRKRIIGWVIAAAFIGAVVVLGYKIISPKNAGITAVNHGATHSVSKPGSSNDNVSSARSSESANDRTTKNSVSNNSVPTGSSR